MALADFTDYKTKVASPHQSLAFDKNAFFGSGTNWNSLWVSTQWVHGRGGETITAPTTAAAPDRTTTGAIGQRNPAAGDLRCWIRTMMVRGLGLIDQMSFMIADRLSHQGGLDGTLTTPQTTNLPTAALTRYTTGVGVFAALEIYTTVGSTGTTATVSYTDDAGNAGQTSQPINFGGTGFREAQRILPISLASGDLGVRAVASVTLAATTGTAGNFGVTLYRPILALSMKALADFANSGDPLREIGFHIPKVEDNACLFMIACSAGQASSGIFGDVCFMET
jgi:hypothetical protein